MSLGSRTIARFFAVGLALMLAAGACSSGDDDAAAPPTSDDTAAPQAPEDHAVGVSTETFVYAEPTIAGTSGAEASDRVLETTIFYPAEGTPGAEPVPDAPADHGDGPYPLIVFAHGFGASPQVYAELMEEWARAGYVVAAPRFPNTNTDAPGGVDAGDFVNQPADVSAVITGVQESAAGDDAILAGLVDPDAVGVAGHSLGGITTLGVAAHSCCRDERIDAAVVLSGDPLTFPGGEFDYADAPPILLVHGTDDVLVPYEASVGVFNELDAPKGLMTIEAGDHGAPIAPSGAAFDAVTKTTLDFFDGYLKGDTEALDRIEADGKSETTRVVFAVEPGEQVTVPTQPKVDRDLHAEVTPDAGLVNGQTVTVTWSGYTPGNTINIVQCSNRTEGDASACDLQHGKILQPNPAGDGSLPLEIVVGPVGTGICDADHADCQIVVNDGGSLDPAASVRISISFAPS